MSVDEQTTASLLISHVRREHVGKRVDQVLSELFGEYSRSRLQRWIKEGRVTLDGNPCRSKDKVLGGEEIKLQPVLSKEVSIQAEAIPLEILYEDDELLVINKPAGLVVHPATGNPDGTLLNALLHHQVDLEKIPRGGIVHRLDKETSGLLVVAKTLQSQTSLVNQLQARSVKREYRAIAQGVLTTGGSVDQPIGRHPVHRVRMAVHPSGKPSLTHYRVLERYRAHSYLRVNLETGRTHQIRVHMAYIHHPLLGDPVYGGRLRIASGTSPELQEALRSFRRQALHAARLELQHPRSGELMAWEAPLPADMQQMLKQLQQDAALS